MTTLILMNFSGISIEETHITIHHPQTGTYVIAGWTAHHTFDGYVLAMLSDSDGTYEAELFLGKDGGTLCAQEANKSDTVEFWLGKELLSRLPESLLSLLKPEERPRSQ